jgi:hypothetical protein
MSDNYTKITDASSDGAERVNALKAFVAEGGLAGFPPMGKESNNHIHTIYSFSPYTPSAAALCARKAGLSVAGSVDHDSYAAAGEMREACAALGLGCVTGFELRANFFHTKFAERKINSPDSAGLAYMTVQGIRAEHTARVRDFLAPICAERGKRNRLMVAKLNALTGLPALSYDDDVLPLSKAREGGSVTERHILYALSLAFVKAWGRGAALVNELVSRFGLNFAPKITAYLSDADNPFYDYDLLGALKSGFGNKIYIQPDENECPRAEVVTAFANSIEAFPAYAYLGDVGESPTGDKKSEKFEDDYLDELFPVLKELGFKAVAYMPPRNTKAQLMRLRSLCAGYGFMEISGVDINSPRQSFNCPELLDPDFANLVETTWKLVR